MTLDRGRRVRTQWTTGRGMRGDDSNGQASFGELNLLNEHPFGKWKQWGLFHHALGSPDKQRVYKLLLEGTISRRDNLPLEASRQYASNRAMSQDMLQRCCLNVGKITRTFTIGIVAST